MTKGVKEEKQMATDFFQITQDNIHTLTKTERELFEYVVKNIHDVKKMSIREFAESRFVSTATIFRFAKKLGFSGYADFNKSLIVTSHVQEKTNIPGLINEHNYRNNYLQNVMETARVMSEKQIKDVVAVLKKRPAIYILTDDKTHTIGQYCERLFIGLNFHAYFSETAYQKQNLVNRIGSQDMILALSYSGGDSELLDFIKRVFIKEKPYLLSITRAENNPLENLSDTNFYVFADELRISNMDLTSGLAMLMVVELLAHEFMNVTKLREM